MGTKAEWAKFGKITESCPFPFLFLSHMYFLPFSTYGDVVRTGFLFILISEGDIAANIKTYKSGK